MTAKRKSIRVQASLDLKTHIMLKVLGVRTGRTLQEVVSHACAYAANSKGFMAQRYNSRLQERKP